MRNIKRYNEIVKQPLPYIVCVIDEYADLIETNKEVEDYIVRLGQKSRAAGIHLIIATQKPLVDVVTSSLKSNLTSVIGFRMKGHNSYMTVFGKSIPYRLLGNGDGVAMLEGNVREFIRFQSPIISLNEQEVDDVIKNLKEILKNRNEYSNEPFVKPIEKIKLYIAQTGETRLAKICEHMQIRMSDVGDLVSQLVKEGWLEKDGKGYKIIASDEELNKWR
ncbi:FtsK/SpoIIIE domain-containing protein [Caldifermentibacillus hisashii]|uniref:FtsK/SpoIIIE domain-containing protein n=1 Tax=Caldifermentibacillus hisashii TaxID=996558 RepID=A0ABU9K2P9_9BACI